MVGFALYFMVEVHVAVDEFDGLAGFADESFDEILGGIGRVFEDDDIPGLRFGEEIEIFKDQDTVAVADAGYVIGIKPGAAEGANREVAVVDRLSAVLLRGDRLGGGRDRAFAAAPPSQVEGVSAGGAGESEMGAAQGVGHTAGGDDECFDGKGAKDKGQDEGDDKGFEGFLERGHGALVSGRVGFWFISHNNRD